MTAPTATNITTSLAHRTALQKALKQVIGLNRMFAIELRRDASAPDIDLAHDLGLALERALDRAYDRSFDQLSPTEAAFVYGDAQIGAAQ